MLKTMRKNVKALKPTLWIIIATFVVAIFAIWGGAGRLGESNRSNALVTIGRERISSDTYYQILRQRLEAMKKQYSQLDRNLIQQLNIPQQILQQLVEEILIMDIARDMKLDVSDKEIRNKIVSYPVFQKDGTFVGFEMYKQILDWNRIPLAEFEGSLKKEILIQKAIQLLTAGLEVSDEDVWNSYKKQNESAKIEYLVVEKDKIELPVKPDAAAIKAFYEKNKAKYKVPEKRTADYLMFKTDDLKKEIKVEGGDIEKYYKSNSAQFKEPEKIKASRIFLTFTEPDKPKVLAQAEELLQKIQAGNDFSTLAKKFSQDDKAKDGGDWGFTDWMSLSAKETEEIRKLDAGRTSGIVEVDGGAAILKVTEKTAEITKSLDEVKATIKNILEDQKARELATERALRIEKTARKQKSLDIAAQKEGLKVRSTGPLKSADPLGDIDPSGAVSQALFSLKKKDVSTPLFTYSGVAVAQLQKIEPERPATLEDVKDEVEEDIMNLQKKEKALEKLNQLRETLNDGWEEVARKNGLEFKTVDAHKHDQYLSLVGESPEADRLVFSLPLREISRPVEFEGGYLVLRVLERKEALPTEFAKAKETERASLLEAEKSKFLQSVLVEARNAKKVKIDYNLFLSLSSEVVNKFSGEE